MKYIAIITWSDGIRVCEGSLDEMLRWSIAGVKRKAGDRYSGRTKHDVPITYVSRYRSVCIRLQTPADAVYADHYWEDPNMLYPTWLAPIGFVNLRPKPD